MSNEDRTPRKCRVRANKTADGLFTINLTRIPPKMAKQVYDVLKMAALDGSALIGLNDTIGNVVHGAVEADNYTLPLRRMR